MSDYNIADIGLKGLANSISEIGRRAWQKEVISIDAPLSFDSPGAFIEESVQLHSCYRHLMIWTVCLDL